jgi:peptide/nickel transport system substrate-binding protein
MTRSLRNRLPLLLAAVWTIATSGAAEAQKRGGILKLFDPGSPANMSMLEPPTIQGEMPMMGVFNNLIVFDQHKPQVSLESIVPDLATEWAWNEDGTELSFRLRQGVR